jgi:hypothetical protein
MKGLRNQKEARELLIIPLFKNKFTPKLNKIAQP